MPRLPQPNDDPTLQAKQVVRSLVQLYPTVECALVHRNPYELLVATILSAQCTDARVNMVTPALFARFPDPRTLAQADLAEVEELIHSTGFFRAKAKNLVAMANLVVELHGGEIPRELDALTALPGVGRKTAHVVLGNAFAIASGVVVDTHVKRLSFRLGLTTGRDPITIERDLVQIIPRKQWVDFSHRLIEHGRRTCVAIRPRCDECAIAAICPKREVKPSGSKRVRE
ncbi:endonuclease III [Singulisphaera acidiphila]|uniref:Endonuclease III n=1 Tax=Singulisphaera acidiphila (strain ATCC BAA-1392 / DSM 18658 / VKM B-2454 / MOB10) TaxID=886293 RepID=L0DF24_SINAD|nr:endonuclease III [Singulisphaera acidiphila]AGA27281.1 endonuclease III [Singulisphaera acidiphila DSM 18658]